MGVKPHIAGAAVFAAFFFLSSQVSATEQDCNAKAFAALIDETAQNLRTLNKDSERRFSYKVSRPLRTDTAQRVLSTLHGVR